MTFCLGIHAKEWGDPQLFQMNRREKYFAESARVEPPLGWGALAPTDAALLGSCRYEGILHPYVNPVLFKPRSSISLMIRTR